MAGIRWCARCGAGASALADPYRAAIYYAPAASDPLWQAGCAWLGRDPETGAEMKRPAVPGLVERSGDPGRYGFHATLKAPMQLRYGFAAFLDAVTEFAARQSAFALPPLAVRNIHGFLALCFEQDCQPMQELAAACVTMLDGHRLAEAEEKQLARAAGRPPRQRDYILRWGYPLVLEEFRFHMTLTDRLADNPFMPAAEQYFALAAAVPRQVNGLAVYVEDRPGAPFRLSHRLPFGP
jgi:hypothetical protein